MRRNRRRWVGALLSIILVSNCGMNVQATGVEDSCEVETPAQTYEDLLQNAHNKKIETNEISGWPQGPNVYGESAIVMDMESGAILYGKGIDEKQYPASITKILTALVALENSSMTDIVTFSKESVDCVKRNYSHIGMKPGEQITMKDALYALMLASANEVAYAIGETVGGTHENFVRMMNAKAEELGCTGTHFTNTNGIYEEDHYTTARDMALISRAAFAHQELLDIVQTLQYTIPPTNLETEPRIFQQKHKLIIRGKDHDDRCIGGKTGYTDEACNTLVSVLEQDNRRVVAVILKSRKDTYPDTKNICNYAFEQFEEVNIRVNEKSKKLCNVDADACVTLPKGSTFADLEWKIDDKGNVNYSYHTQLVGTTKANIKEEPKVIEQKEPRKKSVVSKSQVTQIVKIAVAVVLVLGILLLVHRTLVIRRRRKMKLRRRRRMLVEKERQRRRREETVE